MSALFLEAAIKLVRISDPGEYSSYRYANFDLAWCHHAIVLDFCIFDLKIAATKMVFESLSGLEPFEVSPIYANELTLCVANSPMNRDKMQRDGVEESKTEVFPNHAPRRFFISARTDQHTVANSVAIVSNHVPMEISEVARRLKGRGIVVDIYGIGHMPTLIDDSLLKKYSLVISIGKTVQYCLAARVPIYVYDHFGGPGWLTRNNFNLAAYHNFSGKCTNRRLSALEILRELYDGYRPAIEGIEYLFSRAKESFEFEANIERIEKRIKAMSVVSLENIRTKWPMIKRHNEALLREYIDKPRLMQALSRYENQFNTRSMRLYRVILETFLLYFPRQSRRQKMISFILTLVLKLRPLRKTPYAPVEADGEE